MARRKSCIHVDSNNHSMTMHYTSMIQYNTMMTSSNGNIFLVTGPLCWEFTGHQWIPRTKASDAELWCFSLICVWINGCVNNCEAGYLGHHRANYDVTVMTMLHTMQQRMGIKSIMLYIVNDLVAIDRIITRPQVIQTDINLWIIPDIHTGMKCSFKQYL